MNRRRRRITLIGILLLAAGVRLWGLAEYPPGLYPDQAANGFDVLDILDGRLSVYSLGNNGRESLFFYVQALTVGLFGVGVWQMFLASAFVGIATVGVAYGAGARLFGPAVGLFAAFFLATNPWHVTLSRTGFRAVMVPLLLGLALWWIGRMLQSSSSLGRLVNGAVAGAFVGLGVYTYPAYRAFVLFLFACLALGGVRLLLQPSFRHRARASAASIAVAALATVVVLLPLILFFRVHPEAAGTRAAHVSVFNPDLNNGSPLRAFAESAWRTLRAFAFDGDGNPRHNVPLPGLPYTSGGIHHYQGGGAPFLSMLPAALALLGVLAALRRAPWLLLLFLIMLLPAAATAEGIPHGLRTVGAIPAHVWLAGLGAVWAWEWLRAHPWAGVRRRVGVLAGLLLAGSLLADLGLYFAVARNTPLAHYEYRADLTEVSNYLSAEHRTKNTTADASPYLVLDRFSEMTVRFLTTKTGQPYRRLEPARSHETVLQPGEEMVFTESSLPDAARYQSLHSGVVVRDVRENRFGEVVMLILERLKGA